MWMYLVVLLLVIFPSAYGCIATISPDDGITTTAITTAITTLTTTTGSISTTTATTTTTTTAVCLPGWVFYPDTNSCYILYDGMGLDHYQQETYCNTQATNGHLAVVHSQPEMDFVISLTSPGPPGRYVSLGYLRTGPGMTDWTTVDGTPFDYVGWFGPEPDNFMMNEGCVATYTDTVCFNPGPTCIPRGRWNDVTCTDTTDFFICKAPRL